MPSVKLRPFGWLRIPSPGQGLISSAARSGRLASLGNTVSSADVPQTAPSTEAGPGGSLKLLLTQLFRRLSGSRDAGESRGVLSCGGAGPSPSDGIPLRWPSMRSVAKVRDSSHAAGAACHHGSDFIAVP